MSARHARRILANALACMLATSCSLARTRNPQRPPAAPACSTSGAPLTIDQISATLALIGGLVFAIDSGITKNESRELRSGLIAVGLTLGSVGFGISFGVGEKRVQRCRSAHTVTPASPPPS